jgi:glycosyltransferase involved in cell wall biosynthesis/Tfp pilus assembly protein PilF
MNTVLHVIQQLSLGGGTRTLVATATHSARLGPFRHRVVSLLPAAPEALALARAGGVEVLDAPDTPAVLREMAAADIVQIDWWNSPEMQVLLHEDLPPVRLFLWYHVCGDGPPQIITPELVRLADLNVATNPWTARELPAFRDLAAAERAQRVAMVIPGADFNRLAGLTPRPHAGFNVGYIGTVDFVKIHRRYVPLNAAVRVPDVRFLVCGSGGALDTLRTEAQSLGVADRFDFRGFVPDIQPVLELLDAYGYPLCPDTYASGELNLQEVMLAGVPPVVFPHGGIRGLVQHEQTGLVVHTESEYRDALEHLHHEPEARRALGARAQQYARQHFGAANAARELNPLYERLLGLPKRPRSWGCGADLPAWESPVSLLDLTDTPAAAPGARLFVESLGHTDGGFLASLTAQDPDELLAAEDAIARSSALLRSTFSGGVLNYRQVFPNDGFLQLWSGLILRDENQLPAAIGAFGTALDHGCRHWRVVWYIAETAARHGDTALALRAARAVAHTRPGFAPATRLLAQLDPSLCPVPSPAQPCGAGILPASPSGGAGSLPAPTSQARDARLDPATPPATLTDPATAVAQARAAAHAGRTDEFEAALARALELEPGHPPALRLLAELHLQCGQPADAARLCLQLLRRQPDDPSALELLAASFTAAGEQEAATDTYRRLLELDPQHPAARPHLEPLAPPRGAVTPPPPPAAPRVSALVSAYNSERFLRGCLEDLEAQTIAHELEIIVVDSASPQNERAIVEEFQQRYGNIVYLRSPERETVYGAWNRALEVARGRYVTNANTDDRHRRDALEILARTLDEQPDVALVYADCLVTRNENETFDDAHPIRRFDWLDFDPLALLRQGCFVGPQPMWRRDLHEQHGRFDAAMVSAGDYEFWLRLAAQHRFLHVPQTLGLYLESPSSVEHRNRDRAVREIAEARCRHEPAILRAHGQRATPGPTPAPAQPAPLKLPPCARRGHLGDARALFQRRQHPAAWTATLAALAQRPFHPEAWLLLAEIALAAGDSVHARRCAQRARELAPGFKPATRFLKGRLRGSARPSWLVLPAPLAFDAPSTPPRLSVCLIVKNEERFLAQCLASIQGLADQLVIVDTGSTDRTVEIARAHGAELHTFPWNDDFSAARNAALEHATGDWILMLDADEELPPDQHDALRQALKPGRIIAWRLPLEDVGREQEGCSYVPRLFRNAPGLFYVGRVHEQVFTSIEVRRAEWGLDTRLGEARLRHHGYTREVTQARGKVARNLRLLEQAVLELPGDPNLLMNLGLELTRSGRAAEGLDQYRAAFAAMAAQPAATLVPETREMLLTQFASQLLAAGRHAELIDVLTSPFATRHGGLSASLHFTLGLAHLERKQFTPAAEQLRLCLARRDRPTLAPVHPEVRRAGPRHCLALCLAHAADHDAAEREFRLALADDPQSAPARLDYARFLHDRGRSVEALELLHQLATAQPSLAAAWQGGGAIALDRPEFLEVANDWTAEAQRHCPDDPTILTQRAEALTLTGHPESALPLWRRVETRAHPPALAALVVCETVLADHRYQPPASLTAAITNEFVRWYRRLLEFGAENVVRQLNTRRAALARVLPPAARLLEAALAEAAASP